MCGIFGFVANDKTNLTKNNFKQAIRLLFKLSERRGFEATGISIACDNDIMVYKEAINASSMLKKKRFTDFLNRLDIFAKIPRHSNYLTAPIALIGSTRLVINGSQAIPENNQPIIANRIIGVHNGIIVNENSLLRSHLDSEKIGGNDSAVLFGIIDKFYAECNDLSMAVSRVYNEISGSASIAAISDKLATVILASNTGSLYYYFSKKHNFFVFASEHYIIRRFIAKSPLLKKSNPELIHQVKPDTGLSVNFDNDIMPDKFLLKDRSNKPAFINNGHAKKNYRIIDSNSQQVPLRRCAKCVLPETYPFISFDADGICNYCRKYKKQQFKGYEALERVLEKYRSKDGKPDCLMGYSGGRDSSYCLHLLKTKLRMNPIVYTYDWGLVTNRARNNQAKICGKLGVEQLVRAADINTKRRYIRKNIYAWLKKPELGMVPLFMAGDKMFYYYGRQLRKETGVKLTLFAAGHQLEQMEFKIGFCGVDKTQTNNTKLFHYDAMSKIRLAAWYAKQYLLNPSYINESFIDSVFAYYASFINEDDYIYFYRYIPWDEKLIERTLKEEYGWEADERFGKNQWRMGDGQTAFTNYIYYALAGFSEYDTFRSNQIREGLIARKDAMKFLKDDNAVRMEMLQEFSQLIGFNLEEVLLKINTIPKLYRHAI